MREMTDRKGYKRKWKLINWHKTLASTARRNDESSITGDDILAMWEKQKGLCFWTSLPMELSTTPRHPYQPSIERVRNDLPHTIDNCVLVCWSINSARGSATLDTWLRFLKDISRLNEDIINNHELELQAYRFED